MNDFAQNHRRLSMADVARSRMITAARTILGGLAALMLATTLGGTAVAAPAKSKPADIRQEFVLKRGDTLDGVLQRAGIPAEDRIAVTAALRQAHDTRRLYPGERIAVVMTAGPTKRLRALHLDLDKSTDLTLVAREKGGFQRATEATDDPSLRSVSGAVGKNFMVSMVAAGVPQEVAQRVHDTLLLDPDMPGGPPVGARFRVVYDAKPARARADEGSALQGVIIAVEGREHRLYRYPLGEGLVAFVAPDGRGFLQARLDSPVPGAKITSPWGWRMHPVLDRPAFHKGIDLGAPRGTPLVAPADGTVTFVGERGNYGRLIKVEHASKLTTAYAHLDSYARDLRVGSRVMKGQTIGYVGQSGLATGSHLYYEVFADGQQVDPTGAALAVPIQLSGGSLDQFKRYVATGRPAAR